MAISHEILYITIAAVTGVATGVFLSAWGLGRFYRLSKLRRTAPYLAGMTIAGTSGTFMHLLFGSLYVSIPIGFIAGIGGFTAALWFSSSGKEPASFPRLFSVGTFMFFYFSMISMVVGLLTYALVSYITAPKDMTLYPPPRDMFAKQTANRLRKLYSAQSMFKTRNGKYGTLDELDEGKFFEKELLNEEKTGYIITVEVFEKNWSAVALPNEENLDLPGMRIDESGLVRYRADGRPPTRNDPVYK